MNSYILDEINKYMHNPLKYAILLEGDWGSGKTYFVKEELENIDTIYISLNGIDSINDISFQLAYKLLDEKLVDDKFSKIKKVITKAGGVLGHIAEQKISIPLAEIGKLLYGFKLNGKLVVFDDLERCKASVGEVLGFINNLVEHNEIKVLILANEKEISPNDGYAKIKEKLIYQTFKFVPDLNKLYDNLCDKNTEEIVKNKDFLIHEFERKNHLNIRTMLFIFQRYKELKNMVENIIDNVTTEEHIKKKIYEDLYKYMIVISRDYKMGEAVDSFEEKDKEISFYQLIEKSYWSITSFRFVREFVKGNKVDINQVEEVLKIYVKDMKNSSNEEIASLSLLNRWLDLEDAKVEEGMDELLKDLNNKICSYDVYLKIICFFAQMEHIGFDSKYLSDCIDVMHKNIEAETEKISLNYIAPSVSYPESIDRYKYYKEQLILHIKEHNERLKENNILKTQEQPVGNKGVYFYDWVCSEKQNSFDDRRFMTDTVKENILHIIVFGNVADIRHVISALSSCYGFANVKDFFYNDIDDLAELIQKIDEIDKTKFGKIKEYVVGCLSVLLKECVRKLS